MSFFEYVRDISSPRLRQHISQTENIPSLATIIYDRSSVSSFGWSWQL
ncbi:MAG: hypothetical protein MGG11_14855 [Trichodesmium sp. MAG_R03]|nr:hypothetical protein [Trichodesmium sp. MAG_R03]